MIKFVVIILLVLIAVVIAMLAFALVKPTTFDKLNAVFVMNTNIVFLLMLIGVIDGRLDMYIDIALSYAILGFVTTVVLAKYIGGQK